MSLKCCYYDWWLVVSFILSVPSCKQLGSVAIKEASNIGFWYITFLPLLSWSSPFPRHLGDHLGDKVILFVFSLCRSEPDLPSVTSVTAKLGIFIDWNWKTIRYITAARVQIALFVLISGLPVRLKHRFLSVDCQQWVLYQDSETVLMSSSGTFTAASGAGLAAQK